MLCAILETPLIAVFSLPLFTLAAPRLWIDTVDGGRKNPAVRTTTCYLWNPERNGIFSISIGEEFLPSTVSFREGWRWMDTHHIQKLKEWKLAKNAWFSVFPAKAISGISFWVPFFVKVNWEGVLWGVFEGFLLANIISAWKMEVGCRRLLLLELQNFWNPNSRPIHRWILRVSSDGRNPVNQLRLVVLSHYL